MAPDDALRLHPDVYEPAEDTDLLLRVLTRDEPDLHGALALDVGTGTGAIARGLLALGAQVLASDLNPHALELARHNTGARAGLVRADLLAAFQGAFEVITFNAPYLPSEPEERIEGWLDDAFHGGEGGIETTIRLVRDLPRVLAPEGRAYVVVCNRADLDALRDAAATAGLMHEPRGAERFFFEEVAVWRFARAP